MSESTLRARTTSEIVDAVFVLYRRDAGPYMVLSAIALVPTLLYQLFEPMPTPESILRFDASFWLLILVPTIGWMLGSSLLTAAGSDAYLGQPVDAAAVVRRVIPKLWRVMLCGLLLYFVCVIGLVFVIVPGVYLFARYFGVIPAVIIEDAGVGRAFSRSEQLSRGHKWHVLGTMVLGYLMVIVATVGAGMLARLMPGVALQLTLTSVVTVVVRPILYLTLVVLYYDLRIRGEGFDLEHLAATLDASLPPAPGPSVG